MCSAQIQYDVCGKDAVPEKAAGQVQIVVDGMTASGKSTMVELLSRKLGLDIMPEEFRDQYDLLPRFAYDAKWCLSMQLNFLVTRHAQYLVASEENTYILDRSIYSDKVYADLYYRMGHLHKDQYESYLNLYNQLVKDIYQPKCMLILKCSYEQILSRIMARGRDFEIHQGETYWKALYEAYEQHLDSLTQHGPFERYLVIDTEQFNLVHSIEDQNKLLHLVQSIL